MSAEEIELSPYTDDPPPFVGCPFCWSRIEPCVGCVERYRKRCLAPDLELDEPGGTVEEDQQ